MTAKLRPDGEARTMLPAMRPRVFPAPTTGCPSAFSARARRGRGRALLLACCAYVGLAACDDPKAATVTKGTSAPAATTAAPTAAPTAEKPRMLALSVNEAGVGVGADRFDLKTDSGPGKLTAAVKALPIDATNPVVMVAHRRSRTVDVTALATELRSAGAKKLLVRTDGRDDLAAEVTWSPAPAEAPQGCSLVAKVMKNLTIGLWSAKGSPPRGIPKGFSGPDLSTADPELAKAITGCKSTVAFVAADDTVVWEHAHNLAAAVLKADAKKQLDTIVWLGDFPAGKSVGPGGKAP
jgi:hypothetical protein